MREGLSPEDARSAALRAFGNPTLVMEDVREMSPWTWWDRLGQDLRYALRGFRRSPAFAATAVLSLALGIGANTAIFSILNTLVLRPLPIRDPSTLFQVTHGGDGGVSKSSTYALYEQLKARTDDDCGRVSGQPVIHHARDGRRSCRCRGGAAGHRRLLQPAGHRSGHRHRDRAPTTREGRPRTAWSSSATRTGRAGSGATLASSVGRSRSTRCRTRLSA